MISTFGLTGYVGMPRLMDEENVLLGQSGRVSEMKAMSTPEVPEGEPSRGVRLPRWMVFIIALFIWLVAIPLVHGVLPWAISLLMHRYGWTEGRPGIWNLLGLIPVVAGTACLIWIMVLGFARFPELPKRVKLELTSVILMTNGPYAFSRNPIYLSEQALWLGWSLFYGSVGVFIFIVCLFLWGVTYGIVPREERALEARFGEAYRQYKRTVPRWLGKIRR